MISFQISNWEYRVRPRGPEYNTWLQSWGSNYILKFVIKIVFWYSFLHKSFVQYILSLKLRWLLWTRFVIVVIAFVFVFAFLWTKWHNAVVFLSLFVFVFVFVLYLLYLYWYLLYLYLHSFRWLLWTRTTQSCCTETWATIPLEASSSNLRQEIAMIWIFKFF